MRRLALVLFLAATLPALGQPPEPAKLPPSVTGTATPTPGPVSPASGTTTPTTAPIARFQNLRDLPPETVQAVYAARAGADWLWRMNQSNGRFALGLNPAVKAVLPGDHELFQAMAACGLAEAARFTGDERFAARATQAALALFTLTKPDPADATCRVPAVGCNGVAFAAVLALTVHQLPTADATLHGQAEQLVAFLRKQCQADGSVKLFLRDGDAKLDPDGANLYPGLVAQALIASQRAAPDAGKLAGLGKVLAFYHKAFRAQPQAALAWTLIPACVDYYLLANKDAGARDAAFEMADYLCSCQLTAAEVRTASWVGGFKPTPTATGGEPGFASAACAAALAHAAKLTRHVPDLTRFTKYRQATVDALAFARTLQFSDENADHFEKGFRTRYLVGGVHLAPSDGTTRIDATAHVVTAHLAFLASGAADQQ